MRKNLVLASVAAAAALGFFAGTRLSAEETAAGPVYELRTYTAAPGKMEELHARFRNHTNALFVKHGIKPIWYGTVNEGPDAGNVMIYLIEHKSRDAAKKSWGGFVADPDWTAAYKASEANGKLTSKIENKFLEATDYSPLK